MAKNTKTFQNNIKNYDLIREIIRHIYMYGNYSKEDIIKNKLAGSKRSVYDMLRRIKNYLDGEYLQKHKLPNRKTDKDGYRFKYDPFQCPINYLADSYQNCSYVIEDFIFYFTFLQSLKPYNNFNSYKHFYLSQYSEDVSELIESNSFDYDEIISNIHDVLNANENILQLINQSKTKNAFYSEKLITKDKAESRFKELLELGIIEESTNKTYHLTQDIFFDMDINSLESLLLMVKFFYNFSELCIPGYYLSSTINQYIIANHFKKADTFFNKQTNTIFFYKNNSIQNVIDDDILWFILCAINELKPITYKYKNKTGNIYDYEVFPIKIVIEKQYGRHYFYGYNYKYNNFIIQRLDSISSINYSDKEKNSDIFCFLNDTKHNIRDQLEEIYSQNMNNVWNISTSNELYPVLIHFNFPKDEYNKLLSRLLSTGRYGKIIKTGKYSLDYSITVQNELEMKPWIRSFGPYAVVDKDSNPKLYEEIKNDYRKALMNYELI